MGTIMQNLVAARALVDVPDKWRHSRDPALSGSLTILGALYKVTNDNDTFVALSAHAPSGSLVFFNKAPNTTHTDVLSLFDRAISACA